MESLSASPSLSKQTAILVTWLMWNHIPQTAWALGYASPTKLTTCYFFSSYFCHLEIVLNWRGGGESQKWNKENLEMQQAASSFSHALQKGQEALGNISLRILLTYFYHLVDGKMLAKYWTCLSLNYPKIIPFGTHVLPIGSIRTICHYGKGRCRWMAFYKRLLEKCLIFRKNPKCCHQTD